MNYDVIIITNAPGELSTWVKPVVKRIGETLLGARIIVSLVPCPYSSGEESKIASEIPEVAYVLNADETSLFLLTKKLPEGFSFKKRGNTTFRRKSVFYIADGLENKISNFSLL